MKTPIVSAFALFSIAAAVYPHFHSYRGTLSQIGMEMVKTLPGVFAEVKSAGEMDDVSEEDQFHFINEDIKRAG